MTELLTAWRDWVPEAPPYVLAGDEVLLRPDRGSRVVTVHEPWTGYVGGSEFGAAPDSRLHLGLLPIPFAGDLKAARVVILLLNPGLAPIDYFAETEVPAFRERLLANLRQDFAGLDHPFVYLDPIFSWHTGYSWWHGKLRGVIGELAQRWGTSFAQARRAIAQRIAALELVPYHSANFRVPPAVLTRLRSADLARAYVRDVLAPQAAAGQMLLVVARQDRVWQIAAGENVVVYSGAEARAAHLTPSSRGGSRILEMLAAAGPARVTVASPNEHDRR